MSLRFKLYRTARGAVISVFVVSFIFAITALLLGQVAAAQSGYGAKKQPKGPRALGLIELPAKGTAKLIPVVILVDGTYYDASAYKAAPIPMAIESGTVYEGFQDGVSQGLLTLTTALSGPNNTWLSEGRWETESEIAAKKVKKPASSVPRGLEDTDAPPKLLRREAAKKTEPSAPAAPPAASTSAPSSSSTTSSPSTAPQPATSTTQPATATAENKPTAPVPAPPSSTTSTEASATSENTEPAADPNAPSLKRGKTAALSAENSINIPADKANANADVSGKAAASSPPAASKPAASAKKPDIRIFPAISDASGPESHSYDYPMKEGEEQAFRTKMLALAAGDVLKRDNELAANTTSAPAVPPHKGKSMVKPARPAFTDVQLRIFDLSNSNEPTLVLSATAEIPLSKNAPARQYMVTIVAREDIYADLHQAFSSVTDAQHLDIIPRLELIDGVDVDGDGRGELLFRQIYDSGSAYVIYRVIGEQIYALFQGTPS